MGASRATKAAMSSRISRGREQRGDILAGIRRKGRTGASSYKDARRISVECEDRKTRLP